MAQVKSSRPSSRWLRARFLPDNARRSTWKLSRGTSGKSSTPYAKRSAFWWEIWSGIRIGTSWDHSTPRSEPKATATGAASSTPPGPSGRMRSLRPFGLLLIAYALGNLIATVVLGAVFDWPGVLRDRAATVLPALPRRRDRHQRRLLSLPGDQHRADPHRAGTATDHRPRRPDGPRHADDVRRPDRRPPDPRMGALALHDPADRRPLGRGRRGHRGPGGAGGGLRGVELLRRGRGRRAPRLPVPGRLDRRGRRRAAAVTAVPALARLGRHRGRCALRALRLRGVPSARYQRRRRAGHALRALPTLSRSCGWARSASSCWASVAGGGPVPGHGRLS